MDVPSDETTVTIRVRRRTRERLRQLSKRRGLSTPELVERLCEAAEDEELLAEHARAYERLRRADPDRLAAIEDEDREWERSGLRDGLENEPAYPAT